MQPANQSAEPPFKHPDDDVHISTRLADLERAVQDMYEQVPFASHSVGADGTFQHINTRGLRWLGASREDLIGIKKPSDFLTAASQSKLAQTMSERGAFGFDALELEILGKDGLPRPVAMSFNGLRSASGGVHTNRTVCFDLTDSRRKAEDLRMAALAFESLSGMCITNPTGEILRVNQAFTTLTGYSSVEACGQTMSLLSSGQHGAAFFQQMWNALLTHHSWQGEIHNRCKNKRLMVVWLNIAAVPDVAGNVSHYVGTFYDITAHKAAEDALARLAYFDPLTRLPNRRMLQDRLAQEVLAAPRSKLGLALLFVDLDHFKTINDNHGHDIGDVILVAVSQRLQSAVRVSDTVARLGGDEFVVLLCEFENAGVGAPQQVERVARKLLKLLNEPHTVNGFSLVCSASIGISLFGMESNAIEMMQHADLAMYEAKKQGGNALRFFDPVMQATSAIRTAREQALRQALARGEFRLLFQPQVNEAGAVLGAEALLRWHPTGLPEVCPGDFIPLAEETGLIVPIGLWVLDTAVSVLRQWRDDPCMCHLQLAVNVSARQFDQPEFVADVVHRLNGSGTSAARIKLEITESVVMESEQAVDKMNALRALGVRFSMDDFGTGHSSLRSLSRLPLDQLKIDQTFVARMGQHATDALIVRTTIALAQGLGLEVIAEGVETQEQRQFLQRNGCMLYQGFLYGRPMELETFEAFCASHRALDITSITAPPG